jgi:hypothetical protein
MRACCLAEGTAYNRKSEYFIIRSVVSNWHKKSRVFLPGIDLNSICSVRFELRQVPLLVVGWVLPEV